MTLEDPVEKAPGGVVLSVGALVELVGDLASVLFASAGSLGRLGTTRLGDSRERLLSFDQGAHLLLHLGSGLRDLDLVLREIDAVEGDQIGQPDLEPGPEALVLGGLTRKHRVDWILDQVQVLQLRVLHRHRHDGQTTWRDLQSCGCG